MNSFRNTLKKYDIKDDVLKRRQLTTVQVNMGDLCNQRCGHCHVAASPEGKKNMTREVVDQVLGFLSRNIVALYPEYIEICQFLGKNLDFFLHIISV